MPILEKFFYFPPTRRLQIFRRLAPSEFSNHLCTFAPRAESKKKDSEPHRTEKTDGF